ncbi:MAG: hypothetical protein WBP47_19035, partial [Candidatus Promineifilaceae bacterium]
SLLRIFQSAVRIPRLRSVNFKKLALQSTVGSFKNKFGLWEMEKFILPEPPGLAHYSRWTFQIGPIFSSYQHDTAVMAGLSHAD